MSTPILRFDDSDQGVQVDLERLVSSRMLIQGSSGAGKSWLTRYLLEQTHGKIQQFVIDPEGEFATLRERFDYVVASADDDGDVPAHPDSADLLCRQLFELEASAILDIYELDPEDRQLFVAKFLRRLVNMPKETWRPALVVIDEAHEFAPETGSAPPSKRPMELVVSKGRKRGLAAVYLTQRLSKLSKNASDLQNILVGYTGLDTDVRRAGDILGFDKAQRDQLKRLEPGEFFAFGPAISREVVKVRSGDVQTHHPEPGEIRAPTPPPKGALRDLVAQLEGIDERAEEEERTIEALEAKVATLEGRLRKAEGVSGVPESEVQKRIQEATAPLLEARADLESEVEHLRARVGKARPLAEDLLKALRNGDGPARERSGSSRPVMEDITDPPPQPPPETRDVDDLADAQTRILDALATLEELGVDRVSRENAAVWSDQSPKSSAYTAHLSDLRKRGLIDYPGPGEIALTDEGRSIAFVREAISGLEDLHRAWCRYLPDAQRRIVEVLVDVHPAMLSRRELAGRSDQSPRSSAYTDHLATLRALGVAEYPRAGHVAAGEILFPAALVEG